MEVRLRWAEALREACDILEGEAWRRAVQGVERPIHYQGAQVDTIREYSDTLLIFLLKGARPEKYRERFEMRLDDPLKSLTELTGKTEAELLQTAREMARTRQQQATDDTNVN